MSDVVLSIMIEDIAIGGNHRDVNDAAVKRLAGSIDAIGLQHPITVKRKGDGYQLIAGRHRLAACQRLKLEHIQASIVSMNKDEARLWEIAENLHRAELSKLERDQQVAEWISITEKVSGQTVHKPQGGRPEGGISAASRELGIERKDAERAVKVASLSNEAKEVARETGLDDNRSALLKAADAENDVVYLRNEHARREAERERRDTEKANNDINRVIALTDAEQFAHWLMERTDLAEMPVIISWLEGTKPRDVIAALRRVAA